MIATHINVFTCTIVGAMLDITIFFAQRQYSRNCVLTVKQHRCSTTFTDGTHSDNDMLRGSPISSAHLTKNAKTPFVVLNNAYSTTYGLGNKRNYEEAYYLKRITKGWIYRAYPGPWMAYLEKPDGSTELLESYKEKPELRVVAELVREESFKRYAITNDRWMSGRM